MKNEGCWYGGKYIEVDRTGKITAESLTGPGDKGPMGDKGHIGDPRGPIGICSFCEALSIMMKDEKAVFISLDNILIAYKVKEGQLYFNHPQVNGKAWLPSNSNINMLMSSMYSEVCNYDRTH